MLASLWRYVMPSEEEEGTTDRFQPSALEAQPITAARPRQEAATSSSEEEDASSASYSSSFSSSSSSAFSSASDDDRKGREAKAERPFDGRRGIRILKILDEQGQTYVIGHESLKAFILTRRNSPTFKAVQAASTSAQAYAHSLRPFWMSLRQLRFLSDRRWDTVANGLFDVLLLYRLRWAQERGTLKAMIFSSVLQQVRPEVRAPVLLPVKTTAPLLSSPSSSLQGESTMRRTPAPSLYEAATVIELGSAADDDSSVDKELKARKARERQKREAAPEGDESDALRRWNELPAAKQQLLYEAYRRTGTGKRRVTQLGGVFDDGPAPSVDELGDFELPVTVRQFFEERKRASEQKKAERRRTWASRRARRLLMPYAKTLSEPLDDLVTWFLHESNRLALEEEQWAVLDLVAGSFCFRSSEAADLLSSSAPEAAPASSSLL